MIENIELLDPIEHKRERERERVEKQRMKKKIFDSHLLKSQVVWISF